MLIALDPGKRVGGIALFSAAGVLKAADVIDVGTKTKEEYAAREFASAVELWLDKHAASVPTRLVAEWPVAYSSASGSSAAKANDLFYLTATVGAVSAVVPGIVTHVSPAEWKGQLPKEVCQGRIAKRLSDLELAVWTDLQARRGADWHHAADAVGIGLFILGRFKR